MELTSAYRTRFEATGLRKRDRVWSILCASFFNELIGPNQDVLDLACGYGEFINNIIARSKTAVDVNPDVRFRLADDVSFSQTTATKLPLPADSFDVVFTSNFLEHLKSKDELDIVLSETRRVLRAGGRFIVLGPNIKYAYREYWDFYDHYLPLSHLSLEEGLMINGFSIDRVIDRFLPYTMKGRTPSADILVRLYLAIPLFWRVFGKQFLIVARKP